MVIHQSLFLLVICVYCSLGLNDFESLRVSHVKFMFQNSFKPPLIVNAEGHVPFWEQGGDAIPTDDQVRICPSIQDRRGWIWNRYKFEGEHWMFEATFSIAGRNTYGADGMAFWFTSERGSSGNMFGNVPSFSGLGVVIDTFDNDAKGDSPKVAVFLSNGSLDYSHGSDGSTQELQSCQKQVRNLRFPMKMRVVYQKKTLEVWMTDGTHNITGGNYELCGSSSEVYLPSSGFFGISAATGGLSDDHDVMSFIVHKLTPHGQKKIEVLEGHANRLKEYEKFSEDFETKRKPSTQEKKEDWEVRLELEENVRLVHDMQASIVRDVRLLNTKVDQIVSTKSMGGGGGGVSEEKVVAMEGRLSHHLQELKSHITSSGGTGGPAGVVTSEQMQPLYEMKENIKALQQTVDNIYTNIQDIRSSPCPEVITSSSCLSTGFFVFIILVQSAVVVAVLFAKYSQERNAKKFF